MFGLLRKFPSESLVKILSAYAASMFNIVSCWNKKCDMRSDSTSIALKTNRIFFLSRTFVFDRPFARALSCGWRWLAWNYCIVTEFSGNHLLDTAICHWSTRLMISFSWRDDLIFLSLLSSWRSDLSESWLNPFGRIFSQPTFLLPLPIILSNFQDVSYKKIIRTRKNG